MIDKEDNIEQQEENILQEKPTLGDKLQAQYEEELKSQTQDQNPDEVVHKARQFGHLTKEEWTAQGRDPSQWKSPEEFVRYGEQYKEFKDLVSDLKKQNQEQSKKIDILVEDRKRMAEQATIEARQQLEMQLRLAKDRGDMDSVEQLAQRRLQLDQQQQQSTQERVAQEISSVDQVFLSRNGHWFNDSRPDLKQKASLISTEIRSWYPSISYAEVAQKVEERMRFENPELFVNTPAGINRPQVSMSSSAINKSMADSSASAEDRLYKSLSPEERAEFKVIQNQVERIPGCKYLIQEYINGANQLKKRGV